MTSWWYGFEHFWHASGRFVIWKKTFAYWMKDDVWHKILGVGPGSFEIYGPGIQLQQTVPGGLNMVYIWLHNDYLQNLFELGLVGFCLFLALHVQVLYVSYKIEKPWLFLSAFAFSFIELTQAPFRHAPTSIVGLLILLLVMDSKIKDYNVRRDF